MSVRFKKSFSYQFRCAFRRWAAGHPVALWDAIAVGIVLVLLSVGEDYACAGRLKCRPLEDCPPKLELPTVSGGCEGMGEVCRGALPLTSVTQYDLLVDAAISPFVKGSSCIDGKFSSSWPRRLYKSYLKPLGATRNTCKPQDTYVCVLRAIDTTWCNSCTKTLCSHICMFIL